jgi:hypothetical protein
MTIWRCKRRRSFFPWLCQYAAQDGFVGAVFNDAGAAPSLLFALDKACVWLCFERGYGG